MKNNDKTLVILAPAFPENESADLPGFVTATDSKSIEEEFSCNYILLSFPFYILITQQPIHGIMYR